VGGAPARQALPISTTSVDVNPPTPNLRPIQPKTCVVTVHFRAAGPSGPTDKTKGCLSRQTALAMVHRLARSAERSWRRLDGSQRLAQVIQGVRFRDGEPVQAAEEQATA
jgi:hypothetical protein